ATTKASTASPDPALTRPRSCPARTRSRRAGGPLARPERASLSSRSISLYRALAPCVRVVSLPPLDEPRSPLERFGRNGPVISLELYEPIVDGSKVAQPKQMSADGIVDNCRDASGADELAQLLQMSANPAKMRSFTRAVWTERAPARRPDRTRPCDGS